MAASLQFNIRSITPNSRLASVGNNLLRLRIQFVPDRNASRRPRQRGTKYFEPESKYTLFTGSQVLQGLEQRQPGAMASLGTTLSRK
jgi:hypothetical protein